MTIDIEQAAEVLFKHLGTGYWSELPEWRRTSFVEAAKAVAEAWNLDRPGVFIKASESMSAEELADFAEKMDRVLQSPGRFRVLVQEEPEASDPIEVRATPFELMHVANGHPTTFDTPDGSKILVRLATPQEFIELQREAYEQAKAEGKEWPEPMTYEQAVHHTRPLSI